ncbi:hypothetical protein BALOs_1738 [Halobacteriovorax sp. BALOs_7]|uniref:Outer membrane protein beta-barrel domain-containing protein n=1 Tax=Halobacteriovorax vibrionivorans TaxID=2152716 RepID=A0ABY0ICY5_9BACT|nr:MULTISPECIES: hypothetical protein [Halobacteriovorax]AYF44738.1 hypothetical protein BALOs_1738 [Halobacteriovorax sp. BALOs_7]RZF20822.1 hypothetical protein DAY19_12615 [Halobacteriovorax vibrionivorans]TGD48206.1 hypothetical protein EP118_04715 [Halobacteriovorax sp. Y22]
MKRISFLIITLFISLNSFAIERVGRLGVGFSNTISDSIPSLSIKVQRSSTFSYGAIFGVNTADDGGWHGGIRLYRNIFDEPYLTFYTVGAATLINQKVPGQDSESGFQGDVGLGAEFSLQGIDSLGFSVEFGVRFKNLDDFEVTTMGENFLNAGIHFYL